MRIAIVSDIHGNRTAFEAVLADLRETAPDLVVHGGDLADSGASPVEIVDRVRDLGWAGVAGNTDELLFRPASLAEFAAQSLSSLQPLAVVIEENGPPPRAHRLAKKGLHGCATCLASYSVVRWRSYMPARETSGARLHLRQATPISNLPTDRSAGRSPCMPTSIAHTFAALGEEPSSIPAASVFRTTAIRAPRIFCWMRTNLPFGALPTISTKSSKRWPSWSASWRLGRQIARKRAGPEMP